MRPAAYWIIAVCFILPCQTEAQEKTEGPLGVAVPAFDSRDLPADLQWLGKYVSDGIMGRLTRMPSVRVVEMEFMGEILKEHALIQSGAVNPESAAQAGNLLGAQRFVVGTITQPEKRLKPPSCLRYYPKLLLLL